MSELGQEWDRDWTVCAECGGWMAKPDTVGCPHPPVRTQAVLTDEMLRGAGIDPDELWEAIRAVEEGGTMRTNSELADLLEELAGRVRDLTRVCAGCRDPKATHVSGCPVPKALEAAKKLREPRT